MKQSNAASKPNKVLIMLGVPLLALLLSVFAILFSLMFNSTFSVRTAKAATVPTAIKAANERQQWPTGLWQTYQAVHPLTASGNYTQSGELTATDNATDDNFGNAVSVSSDGSTALIGAPYHKVGSNVQAGAVYIFTKSGSTWSQVAELTASDNAANHEFGYVVSLSGDGSTALIGTYYISIGGNNYKGAAYIFTKGNGWANGSANQTAELTASDGVANDVFGGAVSVSNDGSTALIGAPNHTVGGSTYAGAAYIFSKGSGWANGSANQTAELTASGYAASNYFGAAVAVSSDGSTALIGAPYHTIGSNTNAGIGYIFTKSANGWSQVTPLTALDNATNDYFGRTLALSSDGSTVLISAPNHKVGSNTYAGAVYVFIKSSNSWSQVAELTASDNASGDGFGYGATVSSDGSTILIGAVGHNVGGVIGAGAAYIFNKGSGWRNGSVNQTTELTLSNNGSYDSFGNSISISSDSKTVLIAACQRQVGSNTNAGAVYFFKPTTSITLGSSSNPSVYGQSVTFNATVNPTIVTGSVIFTDTTTNTKLGSATISNGAASLATSGLAVGTHQILASYSGDNTYAPSISSNFTQTVNKGNTTVNLTANPNPVGLNANVSIVATVSPLSPAGGVPSGSVIFTDTTTNTKLGTFTLDTNGVAKIITSTLSAGNHVLAASFSGDDNFNAASASPVTLTVSPNSSYYLPFVANNANGFTTYLAFQNVGTTTANVTITYYDKNGNALPSSNFTTQVAKYGEVLPPNPFASGNYGAGVITSDQPLNVLVPESTPYGGSAYVVPSGSSNSLVAPFALNNAYGDFTTQLNIFNWGDNAVTANLTFYGTVGSSTTVISNSTTVYIPAHVSTNLNQSSLPSGFNGWAQISGNANTLVAQVLEQSPSSKFVAIANAVAVPSDIQYAPAIFNAGYGSFYTGANIVNPNSNAVNVTVTYYDQTGNAIPASTFTLGAYSVASIFNGASSGNGLPTGGLPQGFVGAAKVSAVGGGMVVSVNENGGSTPSGNSRSGTYAALASGGSTVGLPVVSNGGYSYITGDTIFNTSNQSVSATIDYYNLDGSQVVGASKTFTVAGGASAAFYHGDGSLPAGFYGTAVISETSGPANALIVTTNAQNVALFYTYSEPNS